MSEERLTLGQYFKQERQNRGIELKEIEQRTKISAQMLKFLEDDHVDMLPPRAFLRGFLQVISKEFELDEEELLRRMEEALALQGQKDTQQDIYSKKNKIRLTGMIIALVIVFIILVIFGFIMKDDEEQPSQGSMGNNAQELVYALPESSLEVLSTIATDIV